MGLLKRLFGICETSPPADESCWKVSGGKLEIDLGRAPELSKPGGAVRLEGDTLPERVLVFHGEDGDFHAFHNKCSHAGRRLDPVAGEPGVMCCSIGKSTFDYQGRLLSGMAKGDVRVFSIEKAEGSLVVDIGQDK